MIDRLLNALNDIAAFGWELIQAELTTTIVIAIITAFAGAFAGASAAQRIAVRTVERNELIKEIRNTNAALGLAFSIFNTGCALKKQHVAALKNDFEAQREATRQSLSESANRSESKPEFSYQIDFHTLPPIVVPMEQLQNIVFDELSVIGRPINLIAVLGQSIDSLNLAITERNRFVNDFRSNPPTTEAIKLQIYFGLADRNGNIDNTYPSFIDAIYQYTNDCIFFSKSLIDDLTKHGITLKKRYTKNFAGEAPKITFIDLSSLEQSDLLPSPEDYKDWTKAFVQD